MVDALVSSIYFYSYKNVDFTRSGVNQRKNNIKRMTKRRENILGKLDRILVDMGGINFMKEEKEAVKDKNEILLSSKKAEIPLDEDFAEQLKLFGDLIKAH